MHVCRLPNTARFLYSYAQRRLVNTLAGCLVLCLGFCSSSASLRLERGGLMEIVVDTRDFALRSWGYVWL